MTTKQSLEKIIEILSNIKDAITTKKAPVVEPKQSDEEFKQKVLATVQEYADEDVDLVAVYEAAKQ